MVKIQRKMKQQLKNKYLKLEIYNLMWQNIIDDIIFRYNRQKVKSNEIKYFVSSVMDILPEVKEYVLKSILQGLNSRYSIAFW